MIPLSFTLLLVGCGGDGRPPDDPKGDTVVEDTDAAPVVDDTEPPESDAPEESDPRVETDAGEETDPGESDPPVALPSPPAWGGAFVDLTALLPPGEMFDVDPGTLAPHAAPQESWGLVADLDEDGEVEVIAGATPWGTTLGRPSARVWRWTQGGLVRAPALEAGLEPGDGPPVIAQDLDGDGHVDLLYGARPLGVRWGVGDGTFSPRVALNLGAPGYSTFYGNNVADVDRDGWLDLLVGDQNCQEVVVPLQRTGPRSYAPRVDWLLDTTPPGSTSSILVMPFGAGDLWVPSTWACSRFDAHPGFYVVDPSGLEPSAIAADLGPADAWWRFLPQTAGGPYTGAAPMGAAAADLDGDAVLDVVLSLTLLELQLLQGRPDGTFVDRTWQAQVIGANMDPPGEMQPFWWSVVSPDLDFDGRPDLFLTQADDATSSRLVRGLLSQPMLFWNGGDWRFEDVTADVGLAIQGSWHGLVLDDPDGDGDADAILGGYGVPTRVLRNDLAPGARGLSLRLVGTTSNHLAIGATVLAQVAGLPDRLGLVGDTGNLSGVGAPWVWLGAGQAGVIDRLEVRWPSGLVQVLEQVPAGRSLTLTEPRTIEVGSATRRAPADGASVIPIEVTPRAVDGSARRGVVTVQLDGAPAALEGWSEGLDGVWRGVVRAPAAPGETRVTAVIDGVPLAVRPRLWWGP